MTIKPALHLVKSNQAELVGSLHCLVLKELMEEGMRLIHSQASLTVDLARVTCSRTAGIALLLSWLREAKKCKKDIFFINLPVQMQAIARICGVVSLLPT